VDPPNGLTLRDLVLRLEGTINGFITTHLKEHEGLVDPATLKRQAAMIESHERTIQRITGALILLSALGIGTLVILVLRITGLLG
jgi:hypothetical protein